MSWAESEENYNFSINSQDKELFFCGRTPTHSPQVTHKYLILLSLRYSGDCFAMEPKLPFSDHEHTREISSSPESSGIGIAARAHACSFIGSDGCFVALFG